MMYVYAQRVYLLPVRRSKLLVIIGLFCAMLAVTQLRLHTGTQTLVESTACAFGLLLLWMIGRKDLLLLKNLLHAPAQADQALPGLSTSRTSQSKL